MNPTTHATIECERGKGKTWISSKDFEVYHKECCNAYGRVIKEECLCLCHIKGRIAYCNCSPESPCYEKGFTTRKIPREGDYACFKCLHLLGEHTYTFDKDHIEGYWHCDLCSCEGVQPLKVSNVDLINIDKIPDDKITLPSIKLYKSFGVKTIAVISYE